MKGKWLRWKTRTKIPEKDPIDELVRSGLAIEIPDGSFDRVWTQAYEWIEGNTNPGLASWELMRTIHRLRLWIRSLAVGLAGITAVLAMILLNNPSDKREIPELAVTAGEERKQRGLLGWLKPYRVEDKAVYELYGFLNDPRVIYGRDIRENGG